MAAELTNPLFGRNLERGPRFQPLPRGGLRSLQHGVDRVVEEEPPGRSPRLWGVAVMLREPRHGGPCHLFSTKIKHALVGDSDEEVYEPAISICTKSSKSTFQACTGRSMSTTPIQNDGFRDCLALSVWTLPVPLSPVSSFSLSLLSSTPSLLPLPCLVSSFFHVLLPVDLSPCTLLFRFPTLSSLRLGSSVGLPTIPLFSCDLLVLFFPSIFWDPLSLVLTKLRAGFRTSCGPQVASFGAKRWPILAACGLHDGFVIC